MAVSSRKKRRAFRNPKRVRRGGSTGFNVAVAAIVILGSVLVLVSRHPNSAGAVGPKLHNSANAQGAADHWHAAIGVNICGTWQPGPIWPHTGTVNGSQTLVRADDLGVYAGLHTHQLSNGQSDGIIHMEPAATSEAGRNATVGKWIEYGGWHLDSTSMKLWPGADGKAIEKKNGDKCGKKAGVLRWAVGEFSQGKKTKLVTHSGNPADFKLYNDNVIAIYFEPAGTNLTKLGAVPSEKNLPDAANNEGTGPSASTTTLPVVPTTPLSTTPGSTTPGATTPGATTPGATTPGATTPGATTPSATTTPVTSAATTTPTT